MPRRGNCPFDTRCPFRCARARVCLHPLFLRPGLLKIPLGGLGESSGRKVNRVVQPKACSNLEFRSDGGGLVGALLHYFWKSIASRARWTRRKQVRGTSRESLTPIVFSFPARFCFGPTRNRGVAKTSPARPNRAVLGLFLFWARHQLPSRHHPSGSNRCRRSALIRCRSACNGAVGR